MKKRISKQSKVRRRRAPIRTTFFELIDELSALTNDDNLVISAVKNIFRTHKITATRVMAPVKLTLPAVRRRVRLNGWRNCFV
jgi:hypothetical protein